MTRIVIVSFSFIFNRTDECLFPQKVLLLFLFGHESQWALLYGSYLDGICVGLGSVDVVFVVGVWGSIILVEILAD